MTEMLVRVDENDNQIGTEEKVKCHQIDGLLHRAFTDLTLFYTSSQILQYF